MSDIAGATPKRRTAPITPVVHAVRVGAVIVAIAALQFLQSFSNLSAGPLLAVVGGAIVILALITILTYLQWQRFEFWFDADGDLRVTSGLLQRRERRLQLSRLQSVDVTQPLLARVFGMAVVKVEVAGGGDSRVTLSYLTVDDANAFRAETLARAAGVRPDAGEAPETVLVSVPANVLFKAGLLNTSVWVTLLIEVLVIVAVVISSGLAGLGLLVAVLIPIITVFGFFAAYFNFTVAESPDGLRTRFGLLGVQAHTVPPGRVASVEFVEPLLWRRLDWVMVRITVAGIQGSDDDDSSGSASTLLPVATWPVASEVVGRVMPGVTVRDFPLAGVPAHVRRRAPFQWRTLGLGHDDHVVVTRRGWLTKRTTVTPHARVQSVRLTQGPWERSLGLASVHYDVVPGPVRAVALHRPASEAGAEVAAEIARMRESARHDRYLRWGRSAPPAASADTPEPQSPPAGPAEPVQPELPFTDGPPDDGTPGH
jgi:putative membrane protein